MVSLIISLSKSLVFFHIHFKGEKKGVLSKVYPAYFWLLLITCWQKMCLRWNSYSFMWVHAQSCPTLCEPKDCSLPGSSVHGILQARILEWVAISFSRGSSHLRNWTQVSCIFYIAGECSTAEPPGKPQTHIVSINSHRKLNGGGILQLTSTEGRRECWLGPVSFRTSLPAAFSFFLSPLLVDVGEVCYPVRL